MQTHETQIRTRNYGKCVILFAYVSDAHNWPDNLVLGAVIRKLVVLRIYLVCSW